MPFAAALSLYGRETTAFAAVCALSLCAAVFPFLLFFLINRHIVRKGEGRLSSFCLPLFALLIPLCMTGVNYIASLCYLAVYGSPG